MKTVAKAVQYFILSISLLLIASCGASKQVPQTEPPAPGAKIQARYQPPKTKEQQQAEYLKQVNLLMLAAADSSSFRSFVQGKPYAYRLIQIPEVQTSVLIISKASASEQYIAIHSTLKPEEDHTTTVNTSTNLKVGTTYSNIYDVVKKRISGKLELLQTFHIIGYNAGAPVATMLAYDLVQNYNAEAENVHVTTYGTRPAFSPEVAIEVARTIKATQIVLETDPAPVMHSKCCTNLPGFEVIREVAPKQYSISKAQNVYHEVPSILPAKTLEDYSSAIQSILSTSSSQTESSIQITTNT